MSEHLYVLFFVAFLGLCGAGYALWLQYSDYRLSKRVVPTGSKWRLNQKPSEDPWADPPSSVLVTVRDCRQGWVRYALEYGSENSLKTVTFLKVYSPAVEPPKPARGSLEDAAK